MLLKLSVILTKEGSLRSGACVRAVPRFLTAFGMTLGIVAAFAERNPNHDPDVEVDRKAASPRVEGLDMSLQ
jgi:hypothetical protein